MYEGLTPSDDFGETGEFDPMIEHTVHSSHVPFQYGPISGALTPENTSVRLFAEKLGWYSRAIVKLGDGSTVSLKLDDDLLTLLSNAGCHTNRPTEPDDSDKAFFEEYAQISADNAGAELENLL